MPTDLSEYLSHGLFMYFVGLTIGYMDNGFNMVGTDLNLALGFTYGLCAFVVLAVRKAS